MDLPQLPTALFLSLLLVNLARWLIKRSQVGRWRRPRGMGRHRSAPGAARDTARWQRQRAAAAPSSPHCGYTRLGGLRCAEQHGSGAACGRPSPGAPAAEHAAGASPAQ